MRFGLQGQAQRFFMFVILSLLLEKKGGAFEKRKAVAEELKGLFAAELLETRRKAKQFSGAIVSGDPFAPYYDSFANAARNPALSPFGILSRMVADTYFNGGARRTAYDRLYALSLAHADKLADRIAKATA